MKLTITVHHVISIDPTFAEILKTIFPNQSIIDNLTTDVKNKTEQLLAVVDENKKS